MRATIDEERRVFLMAGTRTGELAPVRAANRPRVVPIWFVLDGDDLLFKMGDGLTKVADIRQAPRVVVSVDEEAPSFAYVEVRDVASVGAGLVNRLTWSSRIGVAAHGQRPRRKARAA